MTKLHVYEAGTNNLVDTVTITEDGYVDCDTDVARATLEALAFAFADRGMVIPVEKVCEALDGWSDGTLELFAPDWTGDPVEVPNVLADLREAGAAASVKGHVDGAAKLKAYWVHGEGSAKINWGRKGDFLRCVRHLGKYVDDAKGLCNTYHVAALGVAPGQEK
jgi:hypothetical protein